MAAQQHQHCFKLRSSLGLQRGRQQHRALREGGQATAAEALEHIASGSGSEGLAAVQHTCTGMHSTAWRSITQHSATNRSLPCEGAERHRCQQPLAAVRSPRHGEALLSCLASGVSRPAGLLSGWWSGRRGCHRRAALGSPEQECWEVGRVLGLPLLAPSTSAASRPAGNQHYQFAAAAAVPAAAGQQLEHRQVPPRAAPLLLPRCLLRLLLQSPRHSHPTASLPAWHAGPAAPAAPPRGSCVCH